jgi:hypothetical protein
MSRPVWRTRWGTIACLLWTGIVGIPVLQYHRTSMGLNFGDHLHSVILFLTSECLVFWLVARPVPSMETIFNAELIPDDEILTPFRQDEP